jgi:TPR repeat protein
MEVSMKKFVFKTLLIGSIVVSQAMGSQAPLPSSTSSMLSTPSSASSSTAFSSSSAGLLASVSASSAVAASLITDVTGESKPESKEELRTNRKRKGDDVGKGEEPDQKRSREEEGKGESPLKKQEEKQVEVKIAVVDESTLSADELFNQANRLINGDGVIKDEKGAVALYRQAAEKGHLGAMNSLGSCLADGIGVEKDEKEAAKWYRQAAEAGHLEAMYNLGDCFDRGIGVKKDEKKAVFWYQKAADRGDPDAMYNLGVCLEDGTGVVKDEKAAVSCYQKAAEKGILEAMYCLARCLEGGIGVAVDLLAAGDWHSQAAKAGYAPAQKAIGTCLLLGACEFGVNYTKAVAWLEKAAQQNDYDGLCWLGYCRKYGLGTVLNRDAANALFKRAAEQQGDAAVAAWLNQQERDRFDLRAAQAVPELGCFNEDCSICGNKLWSGQRILRPSCCHAFHTTCLQPWLNGSVGRHIPAHTKCPLCNGDTKQAVAGTVL